MLLFVEFPILCFDTSILFADYLRINSSAYPPKLNTALHPDRYGSL